jgi:hypothetical protein
MGKQPDPTPPKETSAASTGTSVSTAIANANLGNVNEITPDGTKTTEQTGSYSWTDPYTNQSYTVPRFTTTQTLSAGQQAIKGQQDAAKLGLATLGNNQTQFLQDYMSKPFDGSNEATESRLMELGRKRLDPVLQQRTDSLATKLSNQGIKLGSTAYDRAMTQDTQGQNDAYNQLLLTGRGQAYQEGQSTRNQPINEITALLSGSQVSQPVWANTQTPTIPTTNNAGIIGQYDQAKAAQAAANSSMFGSVLGGIGGLLSLSDERAKTDISKVGETDDGQNIYKYRYKSGGPMQLGLMAQEVAEKIPDAVAIRPDGLMAVDYKRALENA